MRLRALLASGALLAGMMTPVVMTPPASADTDSWVCLLAADDLGGCVDQPASSTAQLQIDNGAQFDVHPVGTVSNQFTNGQLDNDYSGHQILELFNNNNQNRCVRVNASAPDNPVLGSPGAACDFVEGSSNGEDTRLVSIASCNDNGGSAPFYLETRTLDKGASIILDTVLNGRYSEWDTFSPPPIQ